MDGIFGFIGLRGSKWTIHMNILNMGNPRYEFLFQNPIKEIETEKIRRI